MIYIWWDTWYCLAATTCFDLDKYWSRDPIIQAVIQCNYCSTWNTISSSVCYCRRKWTLHYQGRIQDFHRIFIISQKLHAIKKILGLRGCAWRGAPLDPPMTTVIRNISNRIEIDSIQEYLHVYYCVRINIITWQVSMVTCQQQANHSQKKNQTSIPLSRNPQVFLLTQNWSSQENCISDKLECNLLNIFDFVLRSVALLWHVGPSSWNTYMIVSMLKVDSTKWSHSSFSIIHKAILANLWHICIAFVGKSK